MPKIVAIEPACLGSWPFWKWLVEDNCGVPKGRLISNYPDDTLCPGEDWCRQVINVIRKAKEEGRISQGRFGFLIEKLKTMKHSAILVPPPSEAGFEKADSWHENAIREQEAGPIWDAVITKTAKDATNQIYSVEELHEQSGWVLKDMVIQRTPEAIAEFARELLQYADKVHFVDPCFAPERRFTRTLNLLMDRASRGSPLQSCFFHCEISSKRLPNVEFEYKLKQCCRVGHLELPDGFELVVVRWQRKENAEEGEVMHARYVLTSRGGIGYDYGLDESSVPGQTTDVRYLSEGQYRQRLENLHPSDGAFEMSKAWRVSERGLQEVTWNGTAFV